MGHDARKRHPKSWIGESGRQSTSRGPSGRRGLPCTPLQSSFLANRGRGIVQQSVVCVDDITISCGGWQRITETFPLLREQDSDAAAEQPIKLDAASGRDAPQDDLGGAMRILFSIS